MFCFFSASWKVILLTNDKNLVNKALICKINVHNFESMIEKVKPDTKFNCKYYIIQYSYLIQYYHSLSSHFSIKYTVVSPCMFSWDCIFHLFWSCISPTQTQNNQQMCKCFLWLWQYLRYFLFIVPLTDRK